MKKRDLYYDRIPTKLLRENVRYLGNILGKVIKEQEGENLFKLIEKIRKIINPRRATIDISNNSVMKNPLSLE